MVCEVYDYPTRGLVHSESDEGSSYLVSLCDYPLVAGGFNGSCTCPHFKLGAGRNPSLEKQLIASNFTKVYRCKHIREYRSSCLDFLLPVMCKADPNHAEEQQT